MPKPTDKRNNAPAQDEDVKIAVKISRPAAPKPGTGKALRETLATRQTKQHAKR